MDAGIFIQPFQCNLIFDEREQPVIVRLAQSPLALIVREMGTKRAFMIPFDIIENVVQDKMFVIRRKRSRNKRYPVDIVTIHTDKGAVVLSGERIQELKTFIEIKLEDNEGSSDPEIIEEMTDPQEQKYENPLTNNGKINTNDAKNIEEGNVKVSNKDLVSSTILRCPPSAIVSSIMRADVLINALKQMGCIIKKDTRENGMLFLTHTVPTGIPFPKYITCTQTITSTLTPSCTVSSHVTGTGHKWAAWMDAEWKMVAIAKNGETTLYLYYRCISKAGKSVKFINKLVQDFAIEACDKTARNLRRVSERLNLTLYNVSPKQIIPNRGIDVKDIAKDMEPFDTKIEVEKINCRKDNLVMKNKKTQTVDDPKEMYIGRNGGSWMKDLDKELIFKTLILVILLVTILTSKILRMKNNPSLLEQCAEEEWI